MLRLGIIGCGRVTTMFHINAIKSSGCVELVGIADNSDTRLHRVKTTTGVSYACDDYHKLLNNPEVEVIAINTPPKLHELITLEAMDANKHVLCEKPLAQNSAGCLRIKAKQAEKGLVVLPAHNYVHTPALIWMEKRVREGVIGHIEKATIRFENNLSMYGSKTDFRTTNPIGVVEDVMPHILSVALKLIGDTKDIDHVSGACSQFSVCDNLQVLLKTEHGIDLNCIASWTKMIPTFKIELYGSEGMISSDFATNPYKYTVESKGKKQVYSEKGISWYIDLLRFKHPSFTEQYRHLDMLVHEGGIPRFTIDKEISMIKTMEKISSILRVELK